MKDKQVLLTGGTGGLGFGVTPEILSHGAHLTITYREESEVARLKSRLSSAQFEQIRFVKVDLSQEAPVARLIDDLGRVDVLIHLVGGFAMGSTDEFSYEDWLKMFDLNLNTTFLLCKHCLRSMKLHNYGRIVTIGSRGAVQPGANLAAYCASKAAVVALTQAIADETKHTNITANVVLPSIIDTPANREAMGDANAKDWVSPQSLAAVICFLASEEAKDLRGAAIPVYGSV
jgi:NAD(P)-dependent dehydrogenase (short-subunit alcohol dehydrogenase family)